MFFFGFLSGFACVRSARLRCFPERQLLQNSTLQPYCQYPFSAFHVFFAFSAFLQESNSENPQLFIKQAI
jgi:hypothetical protein